MRVHFEDFGSQNWRVYVWSGERMEVVGCARAFDTDEGWVEALVMNGSTCLLVDGKPVAARAYIPFYIMDRSTGSVMRPDGSIIKQRDWGDVGIEAHL